MFTEKEQLMCSLQKRSNRLKSYGLTDSMLVMGMTVKFIDKDSTLLKVLLLCRDFNEMLKEVVLK
jgi:hypothetical protein